MTLPTPATVAANRLRGRRNHKIGEFCQVEVLHALAALGVTCEPLHNQWTVHRHPVTHKIVNAHQGKKIVADIFGTYRGRSILVEVKHEDGDTISLSRIDQAQRPKLDEWKANGASVHVAWVRTRPVIEIRWITWRDQRWAPGVPFPWDYAHPNFFITSLTTKETA